MSQATTTRLRPAAGRRLDRDVESGAARQTSRLGPWALFLLVFAAQFAFGSWMNARGFLWFDAVSRAASALMSIHGTDPHVAAIGFVWMPLPTFMEMVWVTFYPLWPGIVASGFASTLTSALAGGATAALLLAMARKLGLSNGLGWVFALVVSLNPMLFLYASNGMSEGIAAPFLTGAVAALTMFWASGRRRYVVASGISLALAFACLYEAIHYGALLFAALVLGLVWRSEGKGSSPQGRLRAVQGLGLVFLVPSFYVAALWIGANWAILGDPLFFLNSQYSNAGHVGAASDNAGVASAVVGDLTATLLFVALHTAPFLIPGAFLLVVRALDGRFARANTASLVLLLAMPFAFNVPFVYDGTSFGWLRYFMYPLLVAAGWGLYEVYVSGRRGRAAALVIAGWVFSVPVILWAMSDYDFGRQEAPQVRAVASGATADQTVFYNIIGQAPPIPGYLEREIFAKGEKVAVDSFAGWPISAQISPEHLRHDLIMTPDRGFQDVLAEPDDNGVRYFLVPDPEKVPQDTILRKFPRIWDGEDPAFKLVETFPEAGQRQEWRLYELVPENAD